MTYTNRKPKTVLKVLGIIFIGVGLFLLLIGTSIFILTKKNIENSGTTLGHIIDIEAYHKHRDSWDYETTVLYQVNGITYEEDLTEYYFQWKEGDDIELYYNLSDPSKVKSKSLAYLPVIILSIIAGVFMVIGCSFFIITGHLNKKSKRLKECGTKCYADVVNTYTNFSVRVNGRNPYRLECTCTDPWTAQLRTFKSHNLWEDPGYLLGQQVPVYIDSKNPKKYYVDIESVISNKKELNGF